MTAAAQLIDAGVSVKVLEASNRLGGRMKRLNGFADFPMDLGAEWIHADPEILGEVLGQEPSNMGVETIVYRPKTYQFWHNGVLRNRNFLRLTYSETKFKDTTWLGFFERFVMPKLAGSVTLNAPVSQIELRTDGVSVRTKDGSGFDADKVVVTTPISILKRGDITVSPDIDRWRWDALSEVNFGQGFKAFLKFKERFYPDLLVEGRMTDFSADPWDSKLFYDAAFGKETNDNILGLFNVAQDTLAWTTLSEDDLINAIVRDLDEKYEGAASRLLQGAVIQNWSREPFIRGSYSMDNNSGKDIATILSPVEGRVFFAGEALGNDYQSTVHGAAFSAQKTVAELLDS